MASAQQMEIRAFLARVKKKHGKLNPGLIVAAARLEPKDSYTHRWFTWDNDAAAEAYRLEQARAMITFVRVEYVTTRRKLEAVRYISNPISPGPSDYIELSSIAPQSEHAKDVVLLELGRMRAACTRAYDIATVKEMSHLLDDLVLMLEATIGSVGAWQPPPPKSGSGSRKRPGTQPSEGAGPSPAPPT